MTESVADAGSRILDEMEKAVVGKRDVLRLLLTGVLADGHVLFEDVPGLAKTLIARSLAQVTTLSFARVQFTPDLVPGDITGSTVFDPGTGAGTFQPGPIFANLVLGDEINRAPPKTQAAVLEAMEERQVTTDGVTRQLPKPFLVIATQNPIESGGTYPLPEAQLDRFLFRLNVGYPGAEAEAEILKRRTARKTDATSLTAQIDAEGIATLQQQVEEVHVDDTLTDYIVGIVAATRNSPRTQAGASPRGSLGLLKASRAYAALAGRDFVVPDDVVAVAVPVLAHRIALEPDEWLRGSSGVGVVQECVAQIPTPAAVKPGGALFVPGIPPIDQSASSQPAPL